MNKSVFLILALCFFSFSQTTTKIPESCTLSSPQLDVTSNAGDCDDDGSDEVLTIYRTLAINDKCDYWIGVYSMKKLKYLYTVTLTNTDVKSDYPHPIIGDFDGDGANELLFNKVIYKSTGVLVKKKKLITPTNYYRIINEKDFIVIDSKSDGTLSLFEVNGRVLFNKKLKTGKFLIPKKYPAGTYIINLRYQDYMTFEKVQILK